MAQNDPQVSIWDHSASACILVQNEIINFDDVYFQPTPQIVTKSKH